MADEDANIICGMVYDQNAADQMRVTVVATGLCSESARLSTLKPVQDSLPIEDTSERRIANDRGNVFTPPFSGNVSPYDEVRLEVPTWIRRQTD